MRCDQPQRTAFTPSPTKRMSVSIARGAAAQVEKTLVAQGWFPGSEAGSDPSALLKTVAIGSRLDFP